MPLLKILTDPQNFRFYAGGQGSVSNSTTFGQKSIKYGNDRFNSANSGQPYVTVGIPDNLTPGTTDFLLRGGINVVRDTASDVQRIVKMFADTKSPNGLLFIAKQQLLSRTAPRTQTSGILNEGVYSPLNTLAQAGVVAFGGHLNKQGLNPFAGTGAYANNESLYGVRVKPTQQPSDNRLVQLVTGATEQKSVTLNGIKLNNGVNVMTYTGGPGSNLGIGSTGIRYSLLSQTPLTQFPLSFNFTSDANSLGQNDWTYSSLLLSNPYYNEPGIAARGGQTINSTFSAEGINEASFTDLGIKVSKGGFTGKNFRQNTQSPSTQDFRKAIRSQLGKPGDTDYDNAVQSGITPEAPKYNNGSNLNIDNRTNQGMPGQRSGKSYAKYDQGVTIIAGDNVGKSIYAGITLNDNLGTFFPGLDKINSVPVYRSEQAAKDSQLDDLIPFRIAIIDNDAPNFKTFIHFRAFIDSMSDNYNADWTSFKYLGRGENFYTYQGFTRQISLSWTVAAQSKEELIPMYKRLNYLASSLTPDYSPKGYMRGNLAQLTVGGYLYEQPGIITSLTYDVPEESPWEIGINVAGGEDQTTKQMPHIIRVTGFNFIPIQQFRPSIQELTFKNSNNTNTPDDDTGLVNVYGPQRYISLSNATGNNYNNIPLTTPPLPSPVPFNAGPFDPGFNPLP